MDKKEIKELLKKEIAPLLIGIRNDLEDNKKGIDTLAEELKKKSNFEYELEVDDSDYKGQDGYTPVPDKDYPSEQTVFNFIKDNLPKRGKDYFNEKDIKDIVDSVFALMPSKEELKGKDGQVDYSVVESLALPLIDKKYKAFKKDLDVITNKVFKAIEEGKIPELTASQIRNKLESLSGNDRLSAKAIKGLEKFVGVIIGQSGGGGGFIPTLQQVTDEGNTTTKEIISTNKITGELAKVQTAQPSTQIGDLWWDTDDNTGDGAFINVRIVTTNTTQLDSDEMIVCNSTTPMTVTLLASSGSGKVLDIANVNSGAVTVTCDGTDNINGSSTQVVPRDMNLTIVDYLIGKFLIR